MPPRDQIPRLERKRQPILMKTCGVCGGSFGVDDFMSTKSIFFTDGYINMCNSCLQDYLQDKKDNWSEIDRLCQFMDIPFIPNEIYRAQQDAGDAWFKVYNDIFLSEEYKRFHWEEYNEEFKKLEQAGLIEQELPLIKEEQLRKLREKWGAYDEEGLHYLEDLYEGLLRTQNVNGKLQADQALKICKVSYEIDRRIAAGQDFDKILTAYDKLVKVADFTPKNVKNASDFDSVGEVFHWLSKRGWVPNFYVDVPKDVVDTTTASIQAYNQRLYTNEPGIGEQIDQRIENLKRATELEQKVDDIYGTEEEEYDLEDYNNVAYNELIHGDNDTFDVEV